ncbi:MAG: hypothetical protein NUV53_03820 [Patescibacteria group bacterium]|nr:hypothetical protein [Patescibacteria group bacterium]
MKMFQYVVRRIGEFLALWKNPKNAALALAICVIIAAFMTWLDLRLR